MIRAVNVRQTLSYFGNIGSALPNAINQHRGAFFWKRANGAEDELYAGVRDANGAMQLRQVVTDHDIVVSRGTGDPNGSVTGGIGDLYQRTSANDGTQVYVKVSGSGATGWLPIERAPRRRTRREVLAYHTAALSSSYATVGLKDNPTLSATTYSNADTSGGAYLQLATNTTANNVASIVGGGGTNSAVWLDWRPDVSFGIRVPNTITDIRLWYGVFASSPAASDDPAIAGFGFRFSTNASDTKFQAWSNDGTGGGAITDTGIAVQANYVHDLRCIVNDAATAIDYYIDNAWVAQHTSNLPGGSTALTYGIYCTTLTTAARALRFGRITIETRP